MESESMTVARIREEVAVIDKMFEEATGWGSWMVSSANRREVLINRLHRMGYQDPHKYQARSESGDKVD